jgi:hypothetical protein
MGLGDMRQLAVSVGCLASDGAGNITLQQIRVDGGLKRAS